MNDDFDISEVDRLIASFSGGDYSVPEEPAPEEYVPEEPVTFIAPQRTVSPDEAAEEEYVRPERENPVEDDYPTRPRVERKPRNEITEEYPGEKKKRRKRPCGFIRFCLVMLVTGVAGIIFAYAACNVLANGPSEQLKILFVRSLSDTGSLRKIPYIFLPDEEVNEIKNPTPVDTETIGFEPEMSVVQISEETMSSYESVSEVIDVSGGNWKGKMVLIHDPGLVTLATPESYGTQEAYTVEEFSEMNDAIAAMTAGGYKRNTKTPTGYVIKNGEIMSCVTTAKKTVVGFDANHILHCEYYTAEEAVENGFMDAVTWGPRLVYEGAVKSNLGGGLNPRAAIGQTADGTVMFVVIEGRQLGSMGCTYDELAQLMYEHGAVTACNLDSGRSSVMVYMGERITSYALGKDILNGERTLPNAFIALKEGSNG